MFHAQSDLLQPSSLYFQADEHLLSNSDCPMKILKNQDPETSVTFEMRRRPLNAFPDIPDEFDSDLVQAKHEGTLSRRVSSECPVHFILYTLYMIIIIMYNVFNI